MWGYLVRGHWKYKTILSRDELYDHLGTSWELDYLVRENTGNMWLSCLAIYWEYVNIFSGKTGHMRLSFQGSPWHPGSIRPSSQGKTFWPSCQWTNLELDHHVRDTGNMSLYFSGITGNVCPSCGDTKGIYDYLIRGNTGNICQGTN